jgi:hypothetical protein
MVASNILTNYTAIRVTDNGGRKIKRKGKLIKMGTFQNRYFIMRILNLKKKSNEIKYY